MSSNDKVIDTIVKSFFSDQSANTSSKKYYHVRQFLPLLNFTTLVKHGLIPDLRPFVKKYEMIKFPAWVYKCGDDGRSFFGMFMDYVARRQFVDSFPDKHFEFNMDTDEDSAKYCDRTLHWNKVYSSCYKLAQQHYDFNKIKVDEKTLNNYIPTLQNIKKDLTQLWIKYDCLGDNIEYNTEWFHSDIITAHPDIVTSNSVLDIKTTTSFGKMADESFLQILCYCAILRANGRKVDYIGLVLPMQRDILVFDVSDWNSKSFLDYCVSLVQPKSTALVDCTVFQGIGYHISKRMPGKNDTEKRGITLALEKYIERSLKNNKYVPPVQMFLGSTRCGVNNSIRLDEEEINQVSEVIKNFNLRYFVHTPYTINLSAPDKWALIILKEDLSITTKLGGKGVVVHVGKAKDLSDEEATNEMEKSIRQVLDHINENCPLLLETPAGEGTEICTVWEEMVSFFKRFSPEERKKLKLCVDTCHIWGAGYLPLDYIKKWVDYFGVDSVGLVHFNDNVHHKGSRIDEHAFVLDGKGKIGISHMSECAKYLSERNIPMVYE